MEPQMTITAEPELRLVLPGRAENVALVRRALSGVVDVLELGESRLLDINAAVSEACNNVVVHAYGDAEGPLLPEPRSAPAGELRPRCRSQRAPARDRSRRRSRCWLPSPRPFGRAPESPRRTPLHGMGARRGTKGSNLGLRLWRPTPPRASKRGL